MKKEIILHSLICLLAVSCTVQEIDTQVTPLKVKKGVFYASLEPNSSPETRVFIDDQISLHWDAEDTLSIFNQNTLNHPHKFAGETGAISGYFTSVSDPTGEGDDLDFIYAVYPYQKSTTISDEGVLTLSLPAIQTYNNNEGSIDLNANIMVSRTDDNILKFKNLNGYLVLKFYGSGISVKSIRLDGHNQEKLSGEATVTYSSEGNPEVAMTSNAGTSITLNCETPVELSANEGDATIFWMVVPPTSFTQGFRLTVTDTEGRVFFKDTNLEDLEIVRNGMLRIKPIEVMMNGDNLSINSITPVADGINYTVGDDIKYKIIPGDSPRTFIVTMPTVTDFSHFVFDFSFSGEQLIADGKDFVSRTPIDASKPVTLTVRRGNQGINYTLIARNTGLPVVRITTENFTRADIESKRKYQTNSGNWVDEREWKPTDDELENQTARASIRVETFDGKKDCEVDMQIKGRGNATWKYTKRPYALKLVKKTSVLGMKKHKRWILLANWKDRTLLRNDAAFWLSQQVSDSIKSPSFPYSVHGQFVELEFNGEYRGNYYLCEQIKIDKNRLNITEIQDEEEGSADPYLITGPYLMEIDNNYDEPYKFQSGFYKDRRGRVQGLKYMFKEPDENIPDAAINYMTNHIQQMEALIKDIPNHPNEYRIYLDMDSAIWFMFINELTGNGDFFNSDSTDPSSQWYGPHSTYLYKDRDKADGTVSKIYMGPIWDFDYLTFYDKSGSRSNKWVGVAESNYYFYYFTQDTLFRKRAQELWRMYKPKIESATLTYIDNMKNHISLSEELNTEMWGYNGEDQDQNGDNGDSFDLAVSKMKSAFTKKLNFMNAKIEHGTVNDYRNN